MPVESSARSSAWNILLLRESGGPADAGAYQPKKPFLTWEYLFADMELALRWDPILKANQSNKASETFALWFDELDEPDDTDLPICVYRKARTAEQTEFLTRFIKIPTSSDGAPGSLGLVPVLHDKDGCEIPQNRSLANHIDKNCALRCKLRANLAFPFIGIPTGSSDKGDKSQSAMDSPSTAVSTPTKSRKRSLDNSSSGSGPSPDLPNISTDLRPPATPKNASTTPTDSHNEVPASPISSRRIISPTRSRRGSKSTQPSVKMERAQKFEATVKADYRGKCAITGEDVNWHQQAGFPGLNCCHIVPKSLWHLYPLPPGNARSPQALFDATWDTRNCMAMTSYAHDIHDNRLLAVHPDSRRIRIFAPVGSMPQYSNQKPHWGMANRPTRESLEWHYQRTVVHNMLAKFFQQKKNSYYGLPWESGPLAWPNVDPTGGNSAGDAFDEGQADGLPGERNVVKGDGSTGNEECADQERPAKRRNDGRMNADTCTHGASESKELWASSKSAFLDFRATLEENAVTLENEEPVFPVESFCSALEEMAASQEEQENDELDWAFDRHRWAIWWEDRERAKARKSASRLRSGSLLDF